MTYSSGGLIQATDYNGFVSTTSGGNVNATWGTGTGDAGWGQTALSTVAGPTPGPPDTVTATQWATLINTVNSMGRQTDPTFTSRTAPVAGDTISAFSNLGTDITNCYNNRGNATSSGTISSTWTGNVAKTTSTGNGVDSWTITFTHVITFPSADQARYFWNAGGLVRLDMSKTSTGTDKDPDWNAFVASVGTLFISGRVAGAAQTIGGTSYTGLTRSGGSGSPSPFLTTTGWYTLTGGASATTIFQLNESVYPYGSDYIRVTAAVNSGRTELTLTVTWYDAAEGSTSNTISGGTDTTSPYSSFGTAPAVLCRYIPPSTSYLTNSWGTPTIASSVSSPPLPSSVTADIFVAAGGGGGSTQSNGHGGGGGGGEVTWSYGSVLTGSYSVVIGAGGAGETSCQAGDQSAGANSTFSNGGALTIAATAGGRAPSSSNCGDGSAGGGTSGKGWNGGAGTGFGPADGGGGGAGGPGGAVTQTLSGNTLTGPGTNYGGLGVATGYGNWGGGGTRLTVPQIGSTASGYDYGGGYFGAAGTVNTGGGGGGGGLGTTAGSAGGSGVAKVVYQSDTPRASGGTIAPYSSGGNNYWIHTFSSSGTFTVLDGNIIILEYLMVGGGGAGGSWFGGGGGAGGLISGIFATLGTSSYTVSIGAGGSATGNGAKGTNSTLVGADLATITAYGGGVGYNNNGGATISDMSGGSAGGGQFNDWTSTYIAGTPVAGQGYIGGYGYNDSGNYDESGGGGGGAGGAGSNAGRFTNPSSRDGGAGGAGLASSITGSSTYYAGGGGGGANSGSFTGGAGGNGGGGAGGNTGAGTAGTANLGGGGGGAGGLNNASAGGSGIVIVAYAGGSPLYTGGTISTTSRPGYVVHTFTSSGSLAPI